MIPKRVIFSFILIFVLLAAAAVLVRDYAPRIVIQSIAIDTLTPDTRSPRDVCVSRLPKVQAANGNYQCALSNSGRVTSELDPNHECGGDVGVGGCFFCAFECRWKLPRPLDRVHF